MMETTSIYKDKLAQGNFSSSLFTKEYVQYSSRFQTHHFRKKGASWHMTDTSRIFLPKQRLEPSLDVDIGGEGAYGIFRSHLHTANIQTGSSSVVTSNDSSLLACPTTSSVLNTPVVPNKFVETRQNPNYTRSTGTVLNSDGLLDIPPKVILVELYGIALSSWVPSIRKYAGSLQLPTLVQIQFFAKSKYISSLFLGDLSVLDNMNVEFREQCPALMKTCATIVYNSRLDSYVKTKHQEQPVMKDEQGNILYDIPDSVVKVAMEQFKIQDCLKYMSENIIPRQPVVKALGELRKGGFTVVGVTNYLPWEDLTLKSPLKQVEPYLDRIITSKELQHSKTQPGYYTQAQKYIQRKPSECFCIESIAANANTAASVGINVLVSRREINDFNGKGFLEDLSTVLGISSLLPRTYAKL